MRQDDVAAGCPEDKSADNQNGKEFLMKQRATKKIDYQDADTVECVEQDYTPETDLQILEEGRVQKGKNFIKSFRAVGQ